MCSCIVKYACSIALFDGHIWQPLLTPISVFSDSFLSFLHSLLASLQDAKESVGDIFYEEGAFDASSAVGGSSPQAPGSITSDLPAVVDPATRAGAGGGWSGRNGASASVDGRALLEGATGGLPCKRYDQWRTFGGFGGGGGGCLGKKQQRFSGSNNGFVACIYLIDAAKMIKLSQLCFISSCYCVGTYLSACLVAAINSVEQVNRCFASKTYCN